ncbi:MAG: trypsin-like peptidase domain-containing protein [Patescibacteria group bacterium]
MSFLRKKKTIFLSFLLLATLVFGVVFGRSLDIELLDRFFPREETLVDIKREVLTEQSVTIDVVKKSGPAVVTIGIEKSRQVVDIFSFQFGPNEFSLPGYEGREETIEQDIGSGFVISEDGMILTNKHVVSDAEAKYKIITTEDEVYDVVKIYRDPTNDLAILKVDAKGLKTVELGLSSELQVGQFVVAIGTALGEFRNTVTTGVISGLGRGITAGGSFSGSAEKLDNVIQTDAAINPGNSGGPLLNSSGRVIGVNVAVAAQGQNIGFAIPIDVAREVIDNFNETGQFDRPFLGIKYRMISLDLALLNEVPQGAYIAEVIDGSPAQKGGIKVGDIIVEFDGVKLKTEEEDLAKLISSKKIGDEIKIRVWREGQELEFSIKMGQANQ